MLSERGVSGFLHLLTEAAKLAAGTGKKILSHVTVYHMQADVRIVGKDAADTAAKYGQACAVGYRRLDGCPLPCGAAGRGFPWRRISRRSIPRCGFPPKRGSSPGL